MPLSKLLQVAALASVSLTVLSLAACNQNGSSENGAYVATAASEPAPDGGSSPANTQGLPPRSEYQSVANTPPPPLPVYDQPPMPEPGYVWTPGYWDWSDSDADYYWVPGTWIEPPSPGLYWTPGYWRFYNGRYLFSAGYWGPQVGFYGGVDYGYGYVGNGYVGGRWQGDHFYYNSQANNFGGRRIDTVYSQGAPAAVNRASYNGGPGGVHIAPVQSQIDAAHARHIQPAAAQMEQARMARAEPQLRASVNHGTPQITATPRPAAFHAAGAVPPAAPGGYTPPAQASRATPGMEPQRGGGRAERATPGAPNERSPRQVETGRPMLAEHAPAMRPPAEPRAAPEARSAPPRMSEPRASTEIRQAPPRAAEPRPAQHAPAEHAPAPHPQDERRGPEPH